MALPLEKKMEAERWQGMNPVERNKQTKEHSSDGVSA